MMRKQANYLKPLWNFWANIIGGSYFLHHRARMRLYQLCGLSISGSVIRPKVFFYSDQVRIGRGTFINKGCYFYNTVEVTIGDNVYLGPEVMLCTASHQIGASDLRCGAYEAKPVCIGEGTWIGARASIMPGVTVGRGCVIAAGAMVVADCEADGLYAGVPAKRIKQLAEKAPDSENPRLLQFG